VAAFALALATGAAATAVPGEAAAQAAGPWTWRATLYAYLPSIGGSTTFPDPSGTSVSVDAGTVLDNLKFAFMGTLEAHNGRWGVVTDVFYSNLGNTKSGFRDFTLGGTSIPADASAAATYDLKTTLWTIAGQYRVLSEPGTTLDVVAGLRLLDVNASFDWSLSGNVASIPIGSRAGRRSTGMQNWDAIVGLKGRAAFGADGRWFVPYYADIGTGESRLTWQAMAGVGYTFGWGELTAAWRFIDYRMKSGDAIQSLDFSGPLIAASFAW
jgi:hypothetical protein